VEHDLRSQQWLAVEQLSKRVPARALAIAPTVERAVRVGGGDGSHDGGCEGGGERGAWARHGAISSAPQKNENK
jgi:hypothetical protein